MNNFEQNAKFYDDLAQVANKLALIAENRLPISPIERDLTLQLLRDAYIAVLQSSNSETSASPAEKKKPELACSTSSTPTPETISEQKPEIKIQPEPASEPEPKPEPIPDILSYFEVEKEVTEPAPELISHSELVPTPVNTPQPEPSNIRIIAPEPEPVSKPAPQPASPSSPIRYIEPELNVAPQPSSKPAPTPTPEPQLVPIPDPQPKSQVQTTPQPTSGELFPKEPATPQQPVSRPQQQPQPKRSLNDLLGREDNSLATQFQHSHIDDLSKAISLNDKFLYIKELFKGKGEDFSKAIQKLNSCQNIDDAFQAIDMMKKYYSWDTTASAYLALCDLVRRKFV